MKVLIGIVLTILSISAHAQTNLVDTRGWRQGLWVGTKPNGNRLELNYVNDTLSGPYKETGKNGELLHFGSYKNGLLEGLTIDYWRKDVLWGEIPYKNGKIDGVAKVYNTDGELWKVINYKEGLMQQWKYYKKGRVKAEANFIDEVLDGDFILYDDKGNVVGKSRYQMGKLVSADSTFNEQGKLKQLRIPNTEGTRIVEIRDYKSDGTIKKIKKVDIPITAWAW